VDSQLTQPKFITYRLFFVTMVVILSSCAIISGFYFSQISDPYIKEVLSLEGDISRGHAMFQINCAGCHGREADGNIGPSLHDVSKRKSKISLINQVISGKTPPMPQFNPNTQEMADLLSYLEEL
jgi:mono/diheme cytochrome c family protein